MKKEIFYILSIFLILCTVSAAFAISGANDFTVPYGFEETNGDEDLANYNNDGFGYNLHIMIQQFDSFDDAKAEMYDTYKYVDNMSVFYDEKYGDEGFEEIIQENGKYYLVSFYTIGGHAGSYSDQALETLVEGIDDFNELNHVTPLPLQ